MQPSGCGRVPAAAGPQQEPGARGCASDTARAPPTPAAPAAYPARPHRAPRQRRTDQHRHGVNILLISTSYIEKIVKHMTLITMINYNL